MRQRAPLTDSEKAALCRGKLAGKSTEAIAAELQCSPDCVKKWWKRFGETALLGCKLARMFAKKGALAHFAPSVAQMALTLKQRYPRWGPKSRPGRTARPAAIPGVQTAERQPARGLLHGTLPRMRVRHKHAP